MPRTKQRFPQVASTALTEEVYQLITKDASSYDCSLSGWLRHIVETYYLGDHVKREEYLIYLTREEATYLQSNGYVLTRDTND